MEAFITHGANAARKVLPVGQPGVITYLHHAYPLSIAAGAGLYHSNWLFNNYVQLRCARELVGAAAITEFDFYLLPTHFSRFGDFLRMPQLFASLLWTRREEIIPAVIRGIDQGWYLQIPLDEFYIPCRAAFGKRHYIHELLVFGYDAEARTLKILGFDDRMEFGEQQIAFRELEDAIALADTSSHYDPGGVRLYRHVASERYPADPSMATEFLTDYCEERDSSQRFRAMLPARDGYVYGFGVYAPLAAFYGTLRERPEAMDIRPLQLLWEHKKCMAERLARWVELEWLPPDDPALGSYAAIVEQANGLRLLGLKYWVSQQPAVLERVSTRLLALRDREREVLEPVLAKLKRKLGDTQQTASALH
jgi:hypothetical protein